MSYGFFVKKCQSQEELQRLMDDWGERQMEREAILAEYE